MPRHSDANRRHTAPALGSEDADDGESRSDAEAALALLGPADVSGGGAFRRSTLADLVGMPASVLDDTEAEHAVEPERQSLRARPLDVGRPLLPT
eukprot:COSAG06_NODE_25815_length_628_cov_0.837429_1_plen_94_part_01